MNWREGRVTRTNFPSTLNETYAYDANNNLTSKTDRKGQTIQYVYDLLNRLTRKIYPDATEVDYIYDLVGKIQSVNDPTGTYSFTYDTMDRLTGTTTSYSFLTARNFTTSYSYDKASNRTGFTDPESGTTYFAHADHLGSTRLLTGVGTSQVSNGGFEQGLTGWSPWNGVQVFSDAARAHAGNSYVQLSAAAGGGAGMQSQEWAVQPGDQLTFGGWVYVESGAATALGWWLAVKDSSHTPIAYIGISNPASPGWIYQAASYTVPAGAAYVFLYAQIYQATASTVLRVDDAFLTNSRLSVTLAQNLDYLPFGELNSADTGILTHKFTGFERDSESNLDHAWFRNNSSALGRWMTPDPLGGSLANPQSLNRYAYVLNNPLAFVDPFGLDCIYLLGDGSGVESIDHDSTVGGCENSGGYWANGFVRDPSWVTIDPNSNNILIYSRFPDGSIGVSLASQTWTQGAFGLSSGSGGNTSGGSYILDPAQFFKSVWGSIKFQIETNVIAYVCKDKQSTRITTSMRNGAILGAARGAYTGFVSGEAVGGSVTFGTSGLAGAAGGTVVGGMVGSIMGFAHGAIAGQVCQSSGWYDY